MLRPATTNVDKVEIDSEKDCSDVVDFLKKSFVAILLTSNV